MADHANRRRAPLEDLRGHSLEVRTLLEQAKESLRLLADLREKARAGLDRGARRFGVSFS